MNIEPTILRKKIEDFRIVRASGDAKELLPVHDEVSDQYDESGQLHGSPSNR